MRAAGTSSARRWNLFTGADTTGALEWTGQGIKRGIGRLIPGPWHANTGGAREGREMHGFGDGTADS